MNQATKLPIVIKNAALKAIQGNAYFAHSENLLLSMLADSNPTVREKAVKKIIQLRREGRQNVDKCQRKFKIPKLNFKAQKYFGMIDWRNECFYEPPLTIRMTGIIKR